MESLEDQLKLLKADLKSYGDEIISHIQSLHSSSHEGVISIKNDPKMIVQMLQQEVIQLTKESDNIAEEFENVDIDECQVLIQTLSNLSTAAEMVTVCDEQLDSHNLLAICKHLENFNIVLTKLPSVDTEIGSGKVCALLRREYAILHSRFVARLQRLLRNCIHVEISKIYVNKSLSSSDLLNEEDYIDSECIPLVDIWTALSLCSEDAFNDCIDMIVVEIYTKIIRPLWKFKKVQFPRIQRTGSSFPSGHKSGSSEPNICELTYSREVHSSSTTTDLSSGTPLLYSGGVGVGPREDALTGRVGPCRMPFAQLLEHISVIVGFAASEVFGASDKVRERGLTSLLSSKAALLVRLTETLTELIPKTESELVTFSRQIEAPCLEFEQKLFNYSGKALSSNLAGSHISSLSDVVSSLDTRYAKIRRREVLNRARELLSADYHNTMLASGDAAEDDPGSAGHIGDSQAELDHSGSFALQTLRFEPCHISLASYRILKLISETMKQACRCASPYLSNVLYQSARDCISLYISIIPIKFADTIESVPKMGAVFYNDCCYISHNTTLLTHMCKREAYSTNSSVDNNISTHTTKELFQSSIGLMDFIPRLRPLGESILVRHVDDQKSTLLELVKRINIRTDTTDENNIDASNASKQNKQKSFVSLNLPPTSKRSIILTQGLKIADRFGLGSLRSVVSVREAPDDVAPTVEPLDENDANNTQYNTTNNTSNNSNNATNEKSSTGVDNDVDFQKGASSSTVYSYNSESQASNVVEYLTRISGQWQGVLQASVYDRVIGHLIDTVFRAVMKPILESDCIAEQCGAELSRVIRIILRSIKVLNDHTERTSRGGHNYDPSSSGHNYDERVIAVCSSLKKFEAMACLLECSLSEIAEQLPRRTFSSFTGAEVVRLVRALFEDTPRRQTLLTAVAEMAV